MQLVAFAAGSPHAFANEQQRLSTREKRKHDLGPAAACNAAPTKDQVLEASNGEFFCVLRGLTRELTHTVAAAARRETAALCAFNIHIISW